MNCITLRSLPHRYWELINKGKRVWETRVLPDVRAIAMVRDSCGDVSLSFLDEDVFVFARIEDLERKVHTYAYLARSYEGRICVSRAWFVRHHILGTKGWRRALKEFEEYMTVLEVMSS